MKKRALISGLRPVRGATAGKPSPKMKHALISVSDRSGLIECARRLQRLGYRIIGTGGTASALGKAEIAVTAVTDITKFPECFGGRVKTMHPRILGGILFRRDDPMHLAEAKKLGIEPIDLVIVNLYPFAESLRKFQEKNNDQLPAKSYQLQANLIEQIDIGGPTLLRSAAKNHESVTVICDPADYDCVLTEIEARGDTSPELRRELAAKAFLMTAAYDALITEYLSEGTNAGVMLTGGQKLRYGENPHQWGKYFKIVDAGFRGARSTSTGEVDNGKRKVESTTNDTFHYPLSTFNSSGWGQQLQGKQLSYLNILDADAAWTAVNDFTVPTAVFVKHACPSGIASNENIDEAFQRAYDADKLSAFGVIIALNRPCTKVIAQKIIDQKIFVEVIVTPSYEQGALEILKQKPNLRVISQSPISNLQSLSYRSVSGGMLTQNIDTGVVTESDLTVVTKKRPTPDQIRDLLFAFTCVKHAKSNAIVFAHDLVTVGVGAGQTSRVDALWIAAKRAGEKSKGAVMASDAFFPFPDSVEEAAKHGIGAIIQPGGSVRDKEVFAKADELGIAMVVTGIRAFRH